MDQGELRKINGGFTRHLKSNFSLRNRLIHSIVVSLIL